MMAKLLTLITLVALVLMTEGFRIGSKKLDFHKLINRRDPFPEPKNPPPRTSNVVTEWVTQRLDNFDPTNEVTWQQRYMMNGEHFLPDGCIFLFLGGEWNITEYRLENSFMEEMSQEFSCYMFYLEHRFFGLSRPTEDVSDESLRFLTIDQALADTAHFIEFIKSSSVTPGAQNSPVIVIGGQYSASLAAWSRQVYPHLVAGAWASSAPVLAIYDQFQFKELSGAVYRHVGGNECYDNIERGFAQVEEMVFAGRHAEVSEMFHLCNVFDDELDVQLFFSFISEAFSLLAQFDQIANVQGVCDLLDDDDHESDAHAIAAVIIYLIEFIGEEQEDECIDIDYQVAIEAERQTSWNSDMALLGFRQYTYLLCTQLGWYHSSNSRFQPFGSSFPAEFRHIACGDIFDYYTPEQMNDNIARFNTIRGGLNPGASNVYYTHGQLDPTRSVGVQVTHFEAAPSLVILGASQGNDLGPSSEDDTQALTDARELVKYALYRWMREAQRDTIVPI
ncbi:Thymus-specific serine protease [Pseudolycoriella hygida]|uniref:Thymus-specific serine protease n=1 Tax=Pseudolycoriella hygida TaxID=35572 RepID=A0A9Q0NGR9_9DIPT|nr:Thymus-specific serine protease [Pseudolycoriella hygida]